MTFVALTPPDGINSDDTTFAAQGRWADGNNVRFRFGKPEVIGGWVGLTGAGNLLASVCRSMFTWMIGSTPFIAYGCAGHLYANQVNDTSPDLIATVSANGGWSFGAFGTILLAAPVNGTLYEWPGTGSAAAVTAAPDQIGAGILVTPQRQVLAFACSEEVSGTYNPRCIRGCDFEDYTDWTSTSSNNAFEHIIDDPGIIVAARLVGEYVLVWTTVSLYIGTFIGDPAQTYRFDRVATGCGAVSINSIAIDGQRAYWLSPDFTWRAWAPGSAPAAIPCPISREFRTNVSTNVTYKISCFFNVVYREVWLFYCDTRDGGSDNSRFVAFNTDSGAWFRGILARSGAIDTRGAYVSGRAAVIMTDISGRAWLHEHIVGAATLPDWHIQSADQYLEEGKRRMMVKGVIPDFENQSGDVSLTLYVRDRPQSTAVTKGPYVLTTATTKKDFRASGKLVAAKFSGSNVYMRLGRPLFDVVTTGER